MQQTSYEKTVWQSKPKKNLVSSITVKEGLKLETKTPKEEPLTSSSWGETTLKQFLENAPYPDFRYFCPSCGSLDVCITINRQSQKIIVDCFDCKKEWFQGFLHKGRTTSCLC